MCDIDLYHNEIGKIIVENIKKYNHDNSSITNSDSDIPIVTIKIDNPLESDMPLCQ